MSKYQEAIDVIKNAKVLIHMHDDIVNEIKVFDKDDIDVELLQDLVDKATPKKVEDKWLNDLSNYNGKCPSCSEIQSELDNKQYCGDCGQAIDWSE